MTDEPFQVRVFTLRTRHATSVGFLAPAQLVHGADEARDALLLELPHSIHLLIDPISGHDPDAPEPVATIIPLMVEPGKFGADLVTLKRPSARHYLSAYAQSRQVSIDDRAEALDWEQFTLVPAPVSSIAQIAPKLHVLAGSSSVAGMALTMASQDDRLSWEIAAALVDCIPPEALKDLAGQLSVLHSYEYTFPALRRRLSGGRDRFEFQVNRLLAEHITRYGWSIGDHSYGNPQIIEPNLGKLTIGKYCSMNDFVIILGNHATDLASTYPFGELARYWPTAQLGEGIADHVAKDVVIGNDVWIGNGALVLPGTTIGDGAVIGAHAVARGDIPPYAIVVGNPGKVIRSRFDQSRIRKLLKVAWWNWPDHKVDRFIPYILDQDVDRFLALAGAPGAEDAIDNA